MHKNYYLGAWIIVAVATVMIHVGISANFGKDTVLTSPTRSAKPLTHEPPPKITNPPVIPPAPSKPCTTTTTTTTGTDYSTPRPSAGVNNSVICNGLKLYGIAVVTGHADPGVATINVGNFNLMNYFGYLPTMHGNRYYFPNTRATLSYLDVKSYIGQILSPLPATKSVEVWAVFECDTCFNSKDKAVMKDWSNNYRQAYKILPPAGAAFSKDDSESWNPDYLEKYTNFSTIRTAVDTQVNKMLKLLCSWG